MKIIIDGTEYEAVMTFRGKGRILYDIEQAQSILVDYLEKYKGPLTDQIMKLNKAYSWLEHARRSLTNTEGGK